MHVSIGFGMHALGLLQNSFRFTKRAGDNTVLTQKNGYKNDLHVGKMVDNLLVCNTTDIIRKRKFATNEKKNTNKPLDASQLSVLV